MTIVELLKEINPEAILIDGLDDAIIGHTDRNGANVAVYNIDKCVSIYKEKYQIDEEQALDDLCFNVFGAYLGINTPVFVTLFPPQTS